VRWSRVSRAQYYPSLKFADANWNGRMSYEARVIKVMIASPSDVAKERQLIRDVIQEWNAVNAEDRKIVLMPVGWETHFSPDMGDRPQAIINKQLLKSSDLLVAVFWTRLGSPTGVAASGTVEEINEHLASGKPAMIYFSSVPVRVDSISDLQQYENLQVFRKDLRSRGLVAEYDDLATFRTDFARNLVQKIITNFLGGEPASELNRLPMARPPHLSEDASALLLEAIQDPYASILCLDDMQGTLVQTNNRQFAEVGNRRSESRWRGAIDELHRLQFIEDRAGKGEVFFVTDAGYRVSDFLKSV
jgi:hypothetical protein